MVRSLLMSLVSLGPPGDAPAAVDGSVLPAGHEPVMVSPEVTAPGSARANPSGAPPMPEIEELDSREVPSDDALGPLDPAPSAGRPAGGRAPAVGVGPPGRTPFGAGGGSFFDPGKLEADDPGGGLVTIRGFVAGAFFVSQRSNTRARDDQGQFERLDPLPAFGGGNAQLYVGAQIWRDAIYARVALEYLSIPQVVAGTDDILAPAQRVFLMESAAVEVNPFAWARRGKTWWTEGFKITAGVFVTPFGLEDENHAPPIQWFTTRPRSFTTARVYPGTWSDAGAALKFKPTFTARGRSIRPFELDVAVINGDACTQTRWTDTLYNLSSVPAPCGSQLRPEERAASGAVGGHPRADVGFLGILPDNNVNKSVVSRLRVFPLPAIDVGGSFVWGKHPRLLTSAEKLAGNTTVESDQAPTWRAGAHLDVRFGDMFDVRAPLPKVRGEFVYGVDEVSPPPSGTGATLTARRMLGAYAQIAQPLYRRKRSNLPGLALQYRFEYADPDLGIPGTRNGAQVLTDFADPYLYDEAQSLHVVGLRYLVVPRFTLKADYTFVLEDGGDQNRLHNDVFAFQFVADF